MIKDGSQWDRQLFGSRFNVNLRIQHLFRAVTTRQSRRHDIPATIEAIVSKTIISLRQSIYGLVKFDITDIEHFVNQILSLQLITIHLVTFPSGIRACFLLRVGIHFLKARIGNHARDIDRGIFRSPTEIHLRGHHLAISLVHTLHETFNLCQIDKRTFVNGQQHFIRHKFQQNIVFVRTDIFIISLDTLCAIELVVMTGSRRL